MKDPKRMKRVAEAKLAAARRREAEEIAAAEREALRQMAKAKVDAAMRSVVRPAISEMMDALITNDVPCETGWGMDLPGHPILTLRLRTKAFPPAIVFTAETSGPKPRLTVHEELENSPKEPRRTEIEEPTREGVADLIGDFLMRAM